MVLMNTEEPMRREVKIVVETERRIEVGSVQGLGDAWGDCCAAYTTMLSLEVAAAMACVGTGAIHYWTENAQFHYQKASAGLHRICEKSFFDHLRKQNFLPNSRSQQTIREVIGTGGTPSIKPED
jgi:hypothetical protein